MFDMSNIRQVWDFVVDCKKSNYDIYIGRPSKWSNPFDYRENTLAKFKVETRKEAINKYEELIRSDPKKLQEIKEQLKGKILGCHCTPKFCHGHVLAWIANFEEQ
jgi:hypothetical protein